MMNSSSMKVRTGVPPHNTMSDPDMSSVERITREAQIWASFVLRQACWSPDALCRKALESTAFSLERGTRSLAIPSKLAGTRGAQEALTTLSQLHPVECHRLSVEADGDRLRVSFGESTLGYVQDKHAAWLRPLLAHGASVYLLQVTGTGRADKFLGCNIAFGHVAAAIERYTRAKKARLQTRTEDEDVLLWRAPDGSCRTNVQHVVRHSPTGISWGYGGSGPADLARSVLLRFTGLEDANCLYQSFKEDVIANVPPRGGRIPASFIRSWIERQRSAD